MKIKIFECPKSTRNYEKNIFGMADAWSTSPLSHRPGEPAYNIVDGRISTSTWDHSIREVSSPFWSPFFLSLFMT